MSKLKGAEETGSPQWRTFGYLGICRDMQNPVTYSDGFYEVSDRDLAIRAVNSYDPHRALIAELVEALEWYGEQTRLCRLVHSGGDAGRNALSADGGNRAAAALTRAKEALK